jgi:putative oxidoreductase
MRALFLLGRAMFGGYFAWNGLNHFLNRRMLSQYAAGKSVAAPETAVQASGAMILAGGVSVAAGIKPRQGLALIVGFLVPVSLQMHRFWEIEDPSQRMSEMVNFTKNMALVGAALALMQVDEPWPLSVDALRSRSEEEEMYVRLGGRDLRALPA